MFNAWGEQNEIMGHNRKPDWQAGRLMLDSRPYLPQVWLLTNPNEAKVDIISQTGFGSLSAIPARTLRPICPDCMWFVWQYCRLYLLEKENRVLLSSWNNLSSSTINRYMQLGKQIILFYSGKPSPSSSYSFSIFLQREGTLIPEEQIKVP